MQIGILDDRSATAKIDRENMLQILEDTPNAYEQAYKSALKAETLPHPLARSPSRLVFVGMGGSAIAADILKNWLIEAHVSIEVVRNSKLPGSVGLGTCVLLASYSGQTAEALNAFKEARKRKSRIACVASEGELLRTCRKYKIPHVQVRTGLRPREALPHLLSASLVILQRWGVCNHRSTQAELAIVTEQLRELEKSIGFARPQTENHAKQLAVRLSGTIPFIYTSRLLEAAGRRFKNQLNENSKILAKFDVLPEMLHNEVEGWHILKEPKFADAVSVVFLRGSEGQDESAQFDQLSHLIRETTGKDVHEISVKCPKRLATILTTVYYCDYVSFYLAIARGVDPTPTETIQSLKSSKST
jgi:glucose/mannose-6-phosphate isomerase